MKPPTVETLVWVLIYGGLLVVALGVFVARSSAGLASVLWIGGGVAATSGVVLIWVRSRMKE